MSQGARASARPSSLRAPRGVATTCLRLTDIAVELEEVAMENGADDGDESLWLESQPAGRASPAPRRTRSPSCHRRRCAPPRPLKAESVAPALLLDRSDEPPTRSGLGRGRAASALAARVTAPAPPPSDAGLDAAPELLPETVLERELDRPEADASATIETVVAPHAVRVEPTEDERVESPVEVMVDVPIDAPADVPIDVPGDAPADVPADVPAEAVSVQRRRRRGKPSPKKFACRCCSGSTSSPTRAFRVQLAARLQPVVDRASADLIATINREVGQLLRTYVAEAIEREIAKWRESNP